MYLIVRVVNVPFSLRLIARKKFLLAHSVRVVLCTCLVELYKVFIAFRFTALGYILI